MPIQAPNADHVKEISASFGIGLTDADATSFAGLLKGVAASDENSLHVVAKTA